jgi:hypothetical protein
VFNLGGRLLGSGRGIPRYTLQLHAWLVGSFFDLESSGFALLSVELDELIPEVFDPMGFSDDGTITAVAGGRW